MTRARPAPGVESARYERVLGKLREICLALPGTTEVVAWGHPTFRVDGKIFVGFGIEAGRLILGFKTDGLEQQELVETEPELYYVAKYVGRHGWVSMYLDGKLDWKRVERHAIASWRLIAPARRLAGLGSPGNAARRIRARTRPARG